MRFTLSWLKKFLDTEASLEQIAHTLTMTGLEVEDIEDKAQNLASFEVAQILETAQHPDADKLKVCKVQTKSSIVQIVCGAPNARAGIKVVLAKVGTLIPNGNFKIKESKIRGVDSFGMMCSYDELLLSKDSDGIIELDDNAVIGDPVASYLGIDDPVIHINITPNRADALGCYGIARDLAASGIGQLKTLEIPSIKESFETSYSLSVKDNKACPLFALREIKGLENKESPLWLKNLLENIGIGSISPVVDVTNYISFSFGQPMHAYDAAKIDGGLTIDTSTSEIPFVALNGKEYVTKNGDIVIKDSKDIHCFGGIIGGQNSSCNENTTSILLEAASFSSDYIAKTGRRIMVDTDSRYRFERNVDREFTLKALDLATHLIMDICGGVASKVKSIGTSKLPVRKIDFPMDFLSSKTGINLGANQISTILEKLGFICVEEEESITPLSKLATKELMLGAHGAHDRSVLNVREDQSTGATTQMPLEVEFSLGITIPSWRYDVSIKEDIVEEIVRIYGYDNIPETILPFVNTSKIIPSDQRRLSDIKRLLASSGYTEVVTWSFMDSQKAKYFVPLKDELTLQNPISSDLDYMRPSILPNLLAICRNNLNRSFHNISLFEIGPIFQDTSDRLINNACAIRTGHTASKNSHGDRRAYDIFDIKADMAIILNSIGIDIDKCQFRENAPSYYHPTRSASLCLGKNILAYFGQVHPTIAKKFDIEPDIFAFELNINELPIRPEKYGKRSEYVTSDYQMITRDYAFAVDQSVPVADLLNFIKGVDKKLVRAVELFDIYSGQKIEPGKKSVALSVNIQNDSKTLTESDIAEINKKIIEGIEQKFSAILRDS